MTTMPQPNPSSMKDCPYKNELHWHVKKCEAHNVFPCFNCMAIIRPTPLKKGLKDGKE